MGTPWCDNVPSFLVLFSVSKLNSGNVFVGTGRFYEYFGWSIRSKSSNSSTNTS